MALFPGSCYVFQMEIVINIPDEFAAQVQAFGLTPEGYVRSLVDDAMRAAQFLRNRPGGR
jgi:hypothetical protein